MSALPFIPKIVIYKLCDPETDQCFYEIELQRGDGTAITVSQAYDHEGVIGALAAFLFGGPGE